MRIEGASRGREDQWKRSGLDLSTALCAKELNYIGSSDKIHFLVPKDLLSCRG